MRRFCGFFRKLLGCGFRGCACHQGLEIAAGQEEVVLVGGSAAGAAPLDLLDTEIGARQVEAAHLRMISDDPFSFDARLR